MVTGSTNRAPGGSKCGQAQQIVLRMAIVIQLAMIVVAILGLLATVVVSNLMGSLDNAKINITRTKISQVESAVKRYYLDFSDYPDSIKDLVNPGSGRPPYVKKAPKDDWNRELIYKRSSGDTPFVIYSMGPDGVKGNKDDIYTNQDK